MLEQCIHTDQAMTSALQKSLKLVGYGDHDVLKYCFSCFEQSVSSGDVHGDCLSSHIITPAYPDNIWFLMVSVITMKKNVCTDGISVITRT